MVAAPTRHPTFRGSVTQLGATMAPGKMATFQPVVPARRQASEANRIALTRCCPLIAKPSRWSRVGVGTIRQAAKRSSAEMPRVLIAAGLERSTTCFRATCARNVSRGSIAAPTPANRRRYSRFATRSLSEKYNTRHRAGCSDLGGRRCRDTWAGDLRESRAQRRTEPVAFASAWLEQFQGSSRSRSLARGSTGAPRQHVVDKIGDHGDSPLPNRLQRGPIVSSSFARWSHFRKSF